MKHDEGRREGHVVIVTVNGEPLNPRLDLWDHSPSGFEWGYGGSGPAQLALALLADHLCEDGQAVSMHHNFKCVLISKLPRNGWRLIGVQIAEVLKMLLKPHP